MWLLDAYTHPNVSVSQRAVVGLLIVLHIYRNRIYLYPELIQRIVLMGDTGSFKEDVARIYRQLLLAQETEKIDKKMREEIRSEEHTSELQSRQYLVCRLLLEKKKKKQ